MSLSALTFSAGNPIFHYVVKLAFSVKIMRAYLRNSAVDWLRAIGDRTDAFRVTDVETISNVKSRTASGVCDRVIELTPTAGSRSIRLVLEAQERVSPLSAVGILQRMTESRGMGVPTLCSRVISERVAELCRSHDVSYFDEAGNCRLAAPSFFLQVEGRKSSRSAPQGKVNPFASKSSRVARILLENPKRDWQVQELANEAQVSLGLVAKVKRALLDQAYVIEQNRRIHLSDPRGLLDDWANSYELSKERLSFYVMQKPGEVELEVARWCSKKSIQYALAELAGAWRLRPIVRYYVSTIYLDSQGHGDVVEDLKEHLQARRVSSGANLVFVVPEDRFVFYQSRNIDDVDTVSPAQLYLDLRKQPGRGEETAQEILDREIKPTW